MRITIVLGSPHRGGSSNLLARRFQEGAEEAGHEVHVFDAGHARIAGCLACEYCHLREFDTCCQKDDMGELQALLESSDMVVLATPVYFFSMSAQLKAAVDRTYAFLDRLSRRVRKMALIAAANNPNPQIMDILVANYRSIAGFIGAEDAGMVLACGCGTPEATKRSRYPQAAYEFGRSL